MLGLTVLLLAAPHARAVDQERLREVITLPAATMRAKMGLTLGFAFSRTRGFQLRLEQPDLADEVDLFRERLAANPVDASLHFRMGEFQSEAGDAAKARESYRRAAALYRQKKRLGARELIDFGEALLQLGELAEGEAALRKAVRRSPHAWRAWTTLARLLTTRLDHLSQSDPLPTEKREESERLLEQAQGCYDQAIAVARKEPRTHGMRGDFRAWTEGRLQASLRAVREGRSTTSPALMPREALDDYKEAVRLTPGDPYGAATLAWYTFFHHTFRKRQLGGDTATGWRALSDDEKRPVREAISQLERMAAQRKGRAAAAALTALGFLQYETFEPENIARGQANLRRAVALAPDLQDAAEMLMHTLAVERQHEELAAFVAGRLKQRDTARLRVILAYALWNTQRLDEAERHLREALRLEPGDAAACLSLAAVLLKGSNRQNALLEVERLLNSIGARLDGSSPLHLRIEHLTLLGLHLARAGAVEAARERLRGALTLDAESPLARDAAALLDR